MSVLGGSDIIAAVGSFDDPPDSQSAQKTRFWDHCDRQDVVDGHETPSGRRDRAV